jgi:hypothetical protein
MWGKGSHRLFWLIVLTFTQMTQAITPDLTSLTSSRLIRMIASEAGKATVLGLQFVDWQRSPADTDRVPSSAPVPNEEREADHDPEEVCLIYSSALSLLQGVLAEPQRTSIALSPMASGPRGSSDRAPASSPFAWVSDKTHSLRSFCRMTC